MQNQLIPTLTGDHYRDPEILEREFERIFFGSWLLAGREEQLKEAGFRAVPHRRRTLAGLRLRAPGCRG